MTNPTEKRDVISDEEVVAMLKRADKLSGPYQQLRAKALVSLLKLFGKRRIENATLHLHDLEEKDGFLYITFETVKKRKLGLYQYLKIQRKKDTNSLNKLHSEIEKDWKEWRETETGQKTFKNKRTKRVQDTNPFAQHITAYRKFLTETHPANDFLFPSARCFFGQTFIFNFQAHLSGRQLLNIVKQLDPSVWCHLFRETKGAEIARKGGMKIEAVYSVMLTLDLEKEQTAWNYVKRYGIQTVETEEGNIE